MKWLSLCVVVVFACLIGYCFALYEHNVKAENSIGSKTTFSVVHRAPLIGAQSARPKGAIPLRHSTAVGKVVPEANTLGIMDSAASPPEVPGGSSIENVPTASLDNSSMRKEIVVNIGSQTFTAKEGNKVFLRGPVSTAVNGLNCPIGEHGNDPHNHLGSFSVFSKETLHRSRAYDCDMRMCLFYCEGHAIHACQARDIRRLGHPASHGCIRVSPENARKLFNWADLGTEVIVQQ